MRVLKILLATCVVLIAAVAFVAPGATAPRDSSFGTKWVGDTEAVADFWTPRRMAAAEALPLPLYSQEELRSAAQPEPGTPYLVEGTGPAGTVEASAVGSSANYPIPFTRTEIEDPSAEIVRAHGKLFGTADGQPFHCSATAVNSDNKSLVWTAAHCVYSDAEGGFFEDLIFVPGYEAENPEPFGSWPVQAMHVPQAWQNDELPFDDYAALVVTPDGSGQLLTDVVGGRGIAFNQQPNEAIEALGYPALPTRLFDGKHLQSCSSTGTWRLIPPLIAIGCDMKQGSSGGGWVIRGEYVVSVTSIGIPGVGPVQFGPYLGDDALALYNSARGGSTVFPQPTPTVSPKPYQKHRMRITLRLRRHLIAKGRTEAVSGFAGCTPLGPVQVVKVKFDRQGNPFIARYFKTVFTRSDGSFRIKLPDKPGYYGAILYPGGYDLYNDCGRKFSVLRTHRH